MTRHITRLTKCFSIAFFLCMATINAKADDIPALSNCTVADDTVHINGFDAWNEFADAYNAYIDDNEANSNFTDSQNNQYSFDDINVFNLKSDIHVQYRTNLKSLKKVPNGKTLTSDNCISISGDINDNYLYNSHYNEFVGIVGVNEGTISKIFLGDVFLQTKQENSSSTGFGILCGENRGTIECCKVYSASIYVFDVIDNNTIMIGALAGINKGTIKNCMVSKVTLKDRISYGKPRTLLFGQIAGADISTSPDISNCCTFITKDESIKGNNYPFVSSVWVTDKYEPVTDENVAWNALTSNRIFVLCSISSTDHLPANISSYRDGQPSGINYKTQEDLFARITEFCEQENSLFNYPDFPLIYSITGGDLRVTEGFGDYERALYSIGSPLLLQTYTLPTLERRDYNGTQCYIIESASDFATMAYMLENKSDDEELVFFFEANEDLWLRTEIPPSLHFKTLPKGCSIIGKDDINSGAAGNTISIKLNEGDTLYPLFETIEEGAILKNFTIKLYFANINNPNYSLGLIESEPNTYNFGILAAVNHGTIENCRFGILNNNEYDTDYGDTCSFYIPSAFNITPQENDIVRIGTLVGSNYGTIEKVYNAPYPTYPTNLVNAQDGNFFISNFVAHNKGKITDVVGLLKPLDKPVSEPSNLKYGYFVASEETGSDINTLFAACEETNCSDIAFETSACKISNTASNYKTTDYDKFELLFVRDNESSFASSLKADFPLHFCDNPDVIKLLKNPASWSATKIDDYGSYFFGVPNLTYKDLAITTRGTTEVEKQELNAFVELYNDTEYETYIELLNGNIPFYSKVDVDINSDFFLPTEFCLGIPEYPYKGVFNGKSHTLGNLCAYYDVYTTTEVDDPNNPSQKTNVLTESGILGVIGKGGKVSNLNIRNAYLGLYSNDDNIKNMDRLNFGLLAGSNAGSISNVSLSIATGVFEDSFKDDAEINTSVVGLNDNDEANTNSQASISNVAVYLANNGLLYRPAYILMYWYNDEDYNNKKTRQKLNFETLYPYWCNAVQLLILKSDFINTTLNTAIDNDDIVNPVFESFCEWFDQLSDADADAMASIITRGNFDEIDDFATLAQSLLTWYYADAQSTLRVADKGLWDAYYDSLNDDDEEGNGVAVVATQNLCKSPGKGRTHKVCSAPKSSGNKSTLLNPYDANAPEETMECTKEEFASGYAANWLNYDEKAFTGNYNKMWSQGLLHPILASAKSPYVVKLEYYNEDNNGKGIGYTTEYPKVGATAAITYTDKPKSILVNGQLPTDFVFGASTATFTVPQTAENVGIVPVRISFDTELQPTALEPETDAQSASQLYVAGNAITVGNAAGCHITVSDLAGRIIFSQKAATDKVNITVPARGLYIVKVGNTAQKIAIK